MSVGGASRGGSTGGASRGASHGGSTRGTTSGSKSAGKSAGKAGHAGKTGKAASPTKNTKQTQQAKKTGHPTQDTFEAKPQNKKVSDTVAKLNPRANYRAAHGQTFCNRFAADYASTLGDKSLQGKTANQQYDHLNSAASGYHKATAAEAMKAAAEGKISFAAYSNPNGHGHIAAVVGETAGKPAIAQAGKKNYNFTGVNYGFSKAHEPSYFVHD